MPVREGRGDPATHRVGTGTPSLDEMLHGGLLPGRPYLIVGPSGTGKTTLALRFLIEGVKHGEETLVVTLEEPPNEMRFNHRALAPEIDRVWVFDAIPDVMRYERTPFKDVAQVRDAVRFSEVPAEIRKTPELTSVEITLTALEQTLKMQCARRKYTRLVIDSLTAMQYFCMKGLDEVVGAQSFLRFLTDLGLTTLLTMESPSEEGDTAERMLVRGEIRLFRWELEGRTVRAIGVEKFRGSSHDIRLHPYRIGPEGLRINLNETVSRDTREIAAVSALAEEHEAPLVVTVGETRPPADPVVALLETVTSELRELATARIDLSAIRETLEQAHASLVQGQVVPAQNALLEARGLVRQMTLGYRSAHPPTNPARRERSRPPPELPELALNADQLQHIVDQLSTAVQPPPVASSPAAEPPAPPMELSLTGGTADPAAAAHHATAVAFGPTFESLDPLRAGPSSPAGEPPPAPTPLGTAPAEAAPAPAKRRRRASPSAASRKRARSPEAAPTEPGVDGVPTGLAPGTPIPPPKKRATRRKRTPPPEGAPPPPESSPGAPPSPAPAVPSEAPAPSTPAEPPAEAATPAAPPTEATES